MGQPMTLAHFADQHLVHAPPVHVHDFETQVVPGEVIRDLGNSSHLVQYETSDGAELVRLLARQRPEIEGILQVLDG